nr:MAG TPA: Protein yfhF, Fe-S cluster, iron, sulfur.3A [Caudoviricetes sp.]
MQTILAPPCMKAAFILISPLTNGCGCGIVFVPR